MIQICHHTTVNLTNGLILALKLNSQLTHRGKNQKEYDETWFLRIYPTVWKSGKGTGNSVWGSCQENTWKGDLAPFPK